MSWNLPPGTLGQRVFSVEVGSVMFSNAGYKRMILLLSSLAPASLLLSRHFKFVWYVGYWFFVLLLDICNIGLFSLSLFSGSYCFASKLGDGISCWLRIWIFKKLECAILRANYVSQSNNVDFRIFSRIICEIFLYLDDLNVVGSFSDYPRSLRQLW